MNTHFSREVAIPSGNTQLHGELIMPVNTEAIVVFSPGSENDRFSKQSQFMAAYLHQKNFGTLMFNLLATEEDREYHSLFDIGLLTARLTAVTKWLQAVPEAQGYPICYFSDGTGAAAALKAAVDIPNISAVVSKAGRPDLVMRDLSRVKAPTLLLAGSMDQEVLQLNKKAYPELKCEKELYIIQGASHLFEEQGTMSKVCERAVAWFEKHRQGMVTT